VWAKGRIPRGPETTPKDFGRLIGQAESNDTGELFFRINGSGEKVLEVVHDLL
jgi:hypothetical protein